MTPLQGPRQLEAVGPEREGSPTSEVFLWGQAMYIIAQLLTKVLNLRNNTIRKRRVNIIIL